MTAKPTDASIERDWKHFSLLWKDAHAKFKTTDTLYERTYEVWNQKKFAKRSSYRPSRPTNIVDHAVDVLLAFEPKVHVYPLRKSKQHEDDADAQEAFVSSVFAESALQSTMLVHKQRGKHLILYGYAVGKGPILDLDSMPKKPVRKESETAEEFGDRMEIYEAEKLTWNPYRLYAPHPSHVLLDPQEKQPHMAIERYYWTSEQLEALTQKKQYQGKSDYVWQVRDDPYEQIECTQVWNDDWHAVSAKNGGLLYTEKNTYGFTPYTHAFSGGGLEETEAQKYDPGRFAKGILESVKDSIIAEAQQFNARHNATIMRGYSRMMSDGTPDEIAEIIAEDGVLPIMRAEWLEYPATSADAFKTAELNAQDIEQGTYVRSVFGETTGNRTIGQDAMQRGDALKSFATPMRQLEEMATIDGNRVLRLLDTIEDLEGELTIQGHKLTKEQIHHSYACKVTFETVDPVIQMQEEQLAIAKYQAGLISDEDVWDIFRIENKTEMRDKMARMRLRRHPYYLQGEMVKAALEEGKKELADKLENERKDMLAQMLLNEGPMTDGTANPNEPPQPGGNGKGGGMPLTPGGVETSQPNPPGSPGANMKAGKQLRKPYGPAAGAAKPAPRRH